MGQVYQLTLVLLQLTVAALAARLPVDRLANSASLYLPGDLQADRGHPGQGTVNFQTCRVPNADFTNGERVTGLRAHERLAARDLPQAFFWGNVNGTNYLTKSRNQHIPQYCGSCWAFGTTSMMSDRLRIRRGDTFPEVVLSAQVLINCQGGGTCHGGNPYAVYEYIAQNGIPDETCQNYEAIDGQCQPFGVCETCVPGSPPYPFLPGNCSAVRKYTRYGLAQYGHVHGGADVDAAGAPLRLADKLKAEIFSGGPIACGIHVTDAFQAYTGGIYSEQVAFVMPNHELSLVGWGEENGTEYWIGRNSWGTYWGEYGYFRIAMHADNLGVEDTCSWAEPIEISDVEPTPLEPAAATAGEAGAADAATPSRLERRGSFMLDTSVQAGTFHNYVEPCLRRSAEPISTAKASPPAAGLTGAALPREYDIRNLSGLDYASINRNQHIPQYCGSCWAHATTSALNDRFALARKDIFPEIDLAPQVLVDCVSANSSNGCRGGDPCAAYSYIQQHGVTDETCSNYQALDRVCNRMNLCKSCNWDGCWPIDDKHMHVYTVESHGKVMGEEAIMAEIAARGPIACGICVTPEFEAYTGGIFVDSHNCTTEMHAIELAGYGEENGWPYWIARNSWGTYWGERGWFRIVRGQGSLGMELNCDWAVPKVPDSMRGAATTSAAAA